MTASDPVGEIEGVRGRTRPARSGAAGPRAMLAARAAPTERAWQA